jgi:hypothetical protein|tara:strand:- start:263 stop:448 length:186 start_codon:yes stop_codon:yes gene_type:complete
MESEFDDSIIDQLLETAENNRVQEEEDDEDLDIERKYYQKPDMEIDPLQANNFLRNFVQGI